MGWRWERTGDAVGDVKGNNAEANDGVQSRVGSQVDARKASRSVSVVSMDVHLEEGEAGQQRT
jgi:hypothetical protein